MLLGGSAALADVSAEQVWADWRAYMEAAGYEMTATETRDGDTLVITDAEMMMAIPEEDTTITMTMGEMSFTDNGDGTVSISIPNDLPIDVLVEGPDGEQADIGINYATKGLSITVSGDPDELLYAYSAAMVGISLDTLSVEGGEVPMEEFGTMELTLANVSGSTEMKIGEMRESVQKISSGALQYLIDVNDPEGEGSFVMRGTAESMDFRGSASLPEDMDSSDMTAMLDAGFGFDGTFSYEGATTEFDFQDGEEMSQAASSSDGGSMRVAMDASQLLYAGDARGVAITVAGSELPFPVDIAAEQSGFNIKMPVSASEDTQDFALAMTLGGFTTSDMIWGLVDPAGQIPRNPATVSFDLSGAIKLFVDLFDPAQMEDIDSGEVMPGEINSLDINGLTVSVAGAELTGEGAFTFDNTDLTTFEGLPAPDGALNLTLVGGNALLDTLVSMGLVPEDQASGARMMMGLFAVPGDAPDTLNSKIEVKSDGQILANGQRIK
ncbi:MAG: DUF2125 domain-containing protein [Roseovarius sp.]